MNYRGIAIEASEGKKSGNCFTINLTVKVPKDSIYLSEYRAGVYLMSSQMSATWGEDSTGFRVKTIEIKGPSTFDDTYAETFTAIANDHLERLKAGIDLMHWMIQASRLTPVLDSNTGGFVQRETATD